MAISKTRGLAIVVSLFVWAAATVHLEAQPKRPSPDRPAKAEPPAPVDPLGRETPRGAMMGFLKNEGLENYAAAKMDCHRAKYERVRCKWATPPPT
jgi:hypothetical protein